jgi:prepilin-type N-terminal cleavage/methylation domain-containing protein
MTTRTVAVRGRDEAGFTLVETLIAVVVLSVGLMAIANLFAMSTSSNVAARHMTAATTQAVEAMEMIKKIPFAGLALGGNGNLDVAAAATHRWAADQPIDVDTDDDLVIDAWEADRDVTGVGTIRVRWQIARVDDQTRLVRIVAASTSPVVRARSRVEFVTYRSCTGPDIGCPANP